MKALKIAATGIVALSLALTGCSGTSKATPDNGPANALPAGVTVTATGGQAFQRNAAVDGGTLRTGTIAPVETLDPMSPLNSGGLPVARAVFDALFVYDKDGASVPELAKSLESTDKGKTWTLKLPADVKFSDGTAFNSEAVKKHVERLASEKSQSRSAGDARNVAKMETPDATTLVLTLKNETMRFPKFFTYGITGIGALVPSPTAVEKYGAGFGQKIVGAGPFTLESFQAGGEIKLKKNPNYRLAGKPHLDGLTFVTATDTQSRLAGTIAGDLDLASTQAASDLVDAEAGGLTALTQETTTYYDILFNLDKAPFDDVRFREAVIRAIDLDGLNKAVFDGLQTPMTGMLPKSNPYYIDTDWPSYDPEKAKALIEEYVKDTGNKAEFKITTTSPPEFQKQAQVMQQMLADAGITMTINVGDQPTMVTEAFAGKFDSQHRFTGIAAETDQALSTDYLSTSPVNNTQGSDPKVDELLLGLNADYSPEHRTQVYTDLQKQFRQWLPIVPLIQHQNGWYVGKKVGNFPGTLPGTVEPDVRELWISK
ncbi:glutathione ABC transporter substrate-binding protein GsiB [Arthrobacter ginkgonis]|uniref:Glutathione ABC transporter substrate-binding protein GsiB n=1 Tax=Arthrobacter ginkgonis TaxID=1630594 RepID=A0ABP7CJX3_9MICC